MARRFLSTWFRRMLPLAGAPQERIVNAFTLGAAAVLGIGEKTQITIGTERWLTVGQAVAIIILFIVVVIAGVLAWFTTPRLDLVCDERFIYIRPDGTQIVRLGVVNHSGKTVKKCRVQVHSFIPQGATFLPRTLRFDHVSTDEVDINPGSDPQYFVRFLDHQDQQSVFNINYADNSPRPVQKGDYVFTLLVSGEDQPPLAKHYDVHTDANNRLYVSPHRHRGPKTFSLFGRLFVTVDIQRRL